MVNPISFPERIFSVCCAQFGAESCLDFRAQPFFPGDSHPVAHVRIGGRFQLRDIPESQPGVAVVAVGLGALFPDGFKAQFVVGKNVADSLAAITLDSNPIPQTHIKTPVARIAELFALVVKNGGLEIEQPGIESAPDFLILLEGMFRQVRNTLVRVNVRPALRANCSRAC